MYREISAALFRCFGQRRRVDEISGDIHEREYVQPSILDDRRALPGRHRHRAGQHAGVDAST